MWSEEFQVELYKMYSKAFDGRDFFIGEQAWNFADYATLQGCMQRRRQPERHLYPRPPSETDRPLFPGQMGAYSEFPLQGQE